MNIKRFLSDIKIEKHDKTAIFIWMAIFIVLINITFQKWGSPIIDCGRDVYVAQRILEGDRLFVDVYYVYGPFAPYFLSFLFLLFGIHLNVAYACGIIVSLICLALLYRISRQLLTPVYALGVNICFIFICIFNPGIFNFIFPYAYSAIFATLFGLLSICFIILHFRKQKTVFLIALGVVVSFGVLTKIDFGFSMFCLMLLYLFLSNVIYKNVSIKEIVYCFGAFFSIIILVGLCLFIQSGWGGFVEYYEYSKISFASPAIKTFVSSLFGLSLFHEKIFAIPRYLFYLIILIFSTTLISFICTYFKFKKPYKHVVFTILYLIILFFSIVYFANLFEQIFAIKEYIGMYIPIFLTVVVFYQVYRLIKSPLEIDFNDLLVLCLSSFSVLTSLRYYFNFYVIGYAVYVLPFALIVVFYCIESFINHMKDKFSDNKNLKLYMGNFFIALFIIYLYNLNYITYFSNLSAITTEKGTILTSEKISKPMNQLISYIRETTGKADEVLLIPEEMLIYFLADRKSPAKFYDFLPMRLTTSEQEQYLIDVISSKKIKLISISNRPTSDYGLTYWGKDYNKMVNTWIKENYKLCKSFGLYQTKSTSVMIYGINVYKKMCPIFIY